MEQSPNQQRSNNGHISNAEPSFFADTLHRHLANGEMDDSAMYSNGAVVGTNSSPAVLLLKGQQGLAEEPLGSSYCNVMVMEVRVCMCVCARVFWCGCMCMNVIVCAPACM